MTIAVEIIPELEEKFSSADDITHHELNRPFISSNLFNEESFECKASSPFYPKSFYIPNQEEVVKLLRQISSFTERKTPVQNIRVIFLATQRISIEIENNLT